MFLDICKLTYKERRSKNNYEYFKKYRPYNILFNVTSGHTNSRYIKVIGV